MKELLAIYKPIGLTPLQLIQQLRKEKPQYKDSTISYAGRLDPMAHGVMLLMVGEETKKREQYLSLPKEYEFTALFGVETDTYDILGLLKHKETKTTPVNVNSIVNNFVNGKIGKQLQLYPPYSSKTVDGKPLFQWAREGKLTTLEIPTHEITITSLQVKTIQTINKEKLRAIIFERITKVQGDFRQAKIKKAWETLFSEKPPELFPTVTFTISCSSGTYIRQLVHELGDAVGCGAIALEIVRTKLGQYSLSDTVKLNIRD